MVGTPRGSPNDIVKNHNSVVDNVKSMIDIPSFAGPVVRPGSLWMRKSNPVIRSSRGVAFLLSWLCKFDYTQLCSCYYYGIKTGKTATGGRPRGNSLFSPFLPKMVVCPRVNLMEKGLLNSKGWKKQGEPWSKLCMKERYSLQEWNSSALLVRPPAPAARILGVEWVVGSAFIVY